MCMDYVVARLNRSMPIAVRRVRQLTNASRAETARAGVIFSLDVEFSRPECGRAKSMSYRIIAAAFLHVNQPVSIRVKAV